MSLHAHFELSESLLQQLHEQAQRLHVAPETLVEVLLNYLYLFENYGSGIFPPALDRPFNEQLSQSLALHHDLLRSLPVYAP